MAARGRQGHSDVASRHRPGAHSAENTGNPPLHLVPFAVSNFSLQALAKGGIMMNYPH